METEEIVKMIIWLVVLVLLIGGVIVLFKGRGGETFETIRNLLRFGR